jgi:hypothetical protein|tara:strand:+ start:120 stop:683 length:564 start_codon:yes stop_codon:yes gene_type:complete
MKISEFANQEYVGRFVEHNKEYGGTKHVRHKRKLKLVTDQPLAKKELSICYMMVVGGEVKKIGQTSGKDGIFGCMSFYGGAGQDDPSQTRYSINLLIREEMERGNTVEIYFQYEELKEMTFNGATGDVTKKVLMSAKFIEDDCVEHYKEVTGGYPDWNFQEDGKKTSYPIRIKEDFANYVNMRKGKK